MHPTPSPGTLSFSLPWCSSEIKLDLLSCPQGSQRGSKGLKGAEPFRNGQQTSTSGPQLGKGF